MHPPVGAGRGGHPEGKGREATAQSMRHSHCYAPASDSTARKAPPSPAAHGPGQGQVSFGSLLALAEEVLHEKAPSSKHAR